MRTKSTGPDFVLWHSSVDVIQGGCRVARIHLLDYIGKETGNIHFTKIFGRPKLASFCSPALLSKLFRVDGEFGKFNIKKVIQKAIRRAILRMFFYIIVNNHSYAIYNYVVGCRKSSAYRVKIFVFFGTR